MCVRRGVAFLFVILLITLVGAGFSLGDKSHSVDASYAPDEPMRGWINVSFENEPVDSMFESDFGSARLIDVIKNDSSFEKTCVPVDCNVDYSTTNPQTTKSFNLVEGGSKTVGLKFDGNIVNIDYINFTLESNAAASCTNQIGIDFLADGKIDTGNTKTTGKGCFWPPTIKTKEQYEARKDNEAYHGFASSNEVFVITNIDTSNGNVLGSYLEPNLFCYDGKVYIKTGGHPGYSADLVYKNENDKVGSWTLKGVWTETASCSSSKRYGCFDKSKSASTISVATAPKKHCQKVKLSQSPGFELGAWAQRITGKKNLKMELREYPSRDTIDGASCELPQAFNYGGEISCHVDFFVNEEKDYYVCIFSESGNGDYKIKGYSDDTNGCGFYDNQNEVAAYQIFAKGNTFGALNNLNINNSASSVSLGTQAKDYIYDNYGSYNCQNGCVVPLKINSMISQTITLKNLKTVYETNLGPGVEANQFYDVSANPAKLNAEKQILNLKGGNFKVPSDFGDYSFDLTLGGKSVLSEEIVVEKVPLILGITPEETVAGLPTKFVVEFKKHESEVKEFVWDFGDDKTEKTTNNNVVHNYNSTGTYGLKVSVVDNNGLSSSKTFDIVVGNPKEVANSTLVKISGNLKSLKEYIASYPEFYREGFNGILKVDDLNNAIKDREREYREAKTEADFIELMGKLISMEVPKGFYERVGVEDLSFAARKEIIDLSALEAASDDNYDSEKSGEYKNAIIAWNIEEMDFTVDYKEYVADYDTEEVAFVRFFELNVKEKDSLSYDSYLILDKLDDLVFKENYFEYEKSGHVIIKLRESENNIAFYTTEEVDFTNLPAFISPGFSRLNLEEGPRTTPDVPDETRWGLIITILVLIFLVVISIYFALRMMNKQKSEADLFKSRNDFFNISSYINAAKRNGKMPGEISKMLKKAGWSQEQIEYALRNRPGIKSGKRL